jgi:serine/threonine-protein kinase RsbW
MAVTEAVQNAIIHGNRLNMLKRVRISEECTREGLWIRVFDEGDGFDHEAYSGINGMGKYLETDKKGLLLIHRLTDEVRFLNNGSIVEMLFRINGIDISIYERRVSMMNDFFRVYQRLNT